MDQLTAVVTDEEEDVQVQVQDPVVNGADDQETGCRDALELIREAVEQRRSEAGVVVEDRGPVGEVEVGGDDEPAPDGAVGQQGEEELGLVGVKLDEPQLIKDEKVDPVDLGGKAGEGCST